MKQACVVLVVALWSVAALALSGCSSPGAGAGDAPSDERWVLGAVYNLTGSQAALDQPSARGAQLAVQQANASGGVRGHELLLVLEDGRSEPGSVAAATSAILAAEPQVAALLGLSDTGMVLAAGPLAAQAGRVFLTSGATSPLLPTQVPEFLFMACFGDDAQAAAAADWAYNERGAREVALLYDAGMDYTRLLRDYFTERFEALGGRVGLVRALDSPVTADELAQVDLIYLASGPEQALSSVRALRALGCSKPIVGGDSFDSDVWRGSPELGGVFFTTHAYLGADSTSPRVQAFREAYLAVNEAAPDAFSALGFDAVGLLLDALERADSDEPADVLSALAETEDYAGVTGYISFEGGRRVPRTSVTLLEVRAGQRHFVRELAPDPER